MSDFDKTNIPTLDDIIDDDKTESIKPDIAESEDKLDLFQAKTEDSTTETEPQSDTTAEVVDKKDSTNKKTGQHSGHYTYEEIYGDTSYQLSHKANYDERITYEDLVETDTVISLEPIVLEQIVENVVKQMMPDLEQQLRFLIQQSLEEKLPEEIINLANDKTSES